MQDDIRTENRAAIIRALVDGVGIRATCRITGASKGAVTRLITELGPACAAYMDQAFQGLTCRIREVDETWAFCYSKAKNVPADKRDTFGYGDVWTFTAIDAETKLMPSFMVGSRDGGTATEFMQDLAGRLVNRVQLTISGDPESRKISTSYIERSNLSIRMGLRRYTRLTNAHSKKLASHCAALAFYFMHYNFAKVHSSLRCSPAMAAGVDSHLWTVEEIVALLPVEAPKKRGPYKKLAGAAD